ncbi:hypothetical protein B4119_1951 [Parageobacillus caldoxylosilyticus]|uniref:Uncharacterized protein n=1 Tax=Saccharococcus caldoxylosilyticus TaxID=81408 RepID=A0A150LKC9_9BACL|nr:hypothetical protein B4119_1951 [Parageobacillus caldoxylosilyticus]
MELKKELKKLKTFISAFLLVCLTKGLVVENAGGLNVR